MRVEYFTLAMQFVVLFAVAGSALSTIRTNWIIRQTKELIAQYRSEIEWMKARIDLIEANGKSSKKAT